MPLFGLTIPWWVKWIVVPAISLFFPALGSILAAVIKLIENIPDPAERKAAIAELVLAAKMYKETGDHAPLAAVTAKYYKKCDGVACPADLKSE
jgi:hypothetical protein